MDLNVEFSTDDLRAQLKNNSVTEILQVLENNVRGNPQSFDARWALFQLLSVQGNWTRAMKQLQMCAQITPEFTQVAYTLRGLIQCEQQRAAVFQEKTRPAFIFEQPAWTEGLIEAIHLNHANQTAAADQARVAALDAAPEVSGTFNGQAFNWMSDGDSRFGPVLELYSVGSYRWCAFDEIKKLSFKAPVSLIDLVWAKVRCVLKEGTELNAYVPVRYPQLENISESALLAKETQWVESGESAVIGIGQKTWITDIGDLALLDCRELIFN